MPGRTDLSYTSERYAEVLKEMVEEGKPDYTGLPTLDAETIRRAYKVQSPFLWMSICA